VLTSIEVARLKLNADQVMLFACSTIMDVMLGTAALRQAMLADLNDTTSPRNAYPAFWAPFALIGEGAAR